MCSGGLNWRSPHQVGTWRKWALVLLSLRGGSIWGLVSSRQTLLCCRGALGASRAFLGTSGGERLWPQAVPPEFHSGIPSCTSSLAHPCSGQSVGGHLLLEMFAGDTGVQGLRAPVTLCLVAE